MFSQPGILLQCLDESKLKTGGIWYSPPVRERIKEARWVLKKILPGVIKNITQWFWYQTISLHQSFLYFSNAFRLPLLHEQKYSNV